MPQLLIPSPIIVYSAKGNYCVVKISKSATLFQSFKMINGEGFKH